MGRYRIIVGGAILLPVLLLMACHQVERRNAPTPGQSPVSQTQPVPPPGTDFMMALVRGDSAKALALIDAGADVNMIDRDGSSAMYFACSSSHDNLNVVRRMLERGARVDAPGPGGFTPLHGACEGVHPDIVDLLLEHHADARAVAWDGNTPLHIVAGASDGDRQLREALTISRLLMAHGADPKARNKESQTAADMARAYHNDSLADFFENRHNLWLDSVLDRIQESEWLQKK